MSASSIIITKYEHVHSDVIKTLEMFDHDQQIVLNTMVSIFSDVKVLPGFEVKVKDPSQLLH